MSDAGKHDALIRSLAADLRAVRPLAAPWVRALGWVAVVGALAVALGSLVNLGALRDRLAAAPDLGLAVAGSILTALLAAFAAFQTSVPDRKPAWALLPLPALALWIGASGFGCLRTWVAPGTLAEAAGGGQDCLLFIIALSVPLSAVLLVMLRRAAPLRPGLTAALGGLAVAASSASLLNFFHPYDAAATDLSAHALAVVLVILANRALARRALSR